MTEHCNTCFFFFPGFHLCLPIGGQQSTEQTPLESQFEKRKPVFVFLQFELQIFQNDKRSLLLFKHVLNIYRTSHDNLGSPSWMFKTPHSCIRSKERFNWWFQNLLFPRDLLAAEGFTYLVEIGNFDFRVDFVCCNSRFSKTLALRPTPGKMSITC